MDAAVILAGEQPTAFAAYALRCLAAQGAPLLAADGGADRLAALGLTPSLILGDGDSLSGEFAGIPRRPFAQRKNFTDGQAALSQALETVTGRVWLCGALGGPRPDHQLANLLLPLFLPGTERVRLLGPDWLACYFGPGENPVYGRPGDTLSLIPLAPCRGLSLKGLEYPLHDYQTGPGDSRTLSNLLTDPRAEVSLQAGLLLAVLIFRPTDDAPESAVRWQDANRF